MHEDIKKQLFFLRILKRLNNWKKTTQLFDYIKVLHEYKTAQATKQMKQTSVQQL